MLNDYITFQRVQTLRQINVIVQLANTIWTEHYTPIIGKDQVTYMLHTYHSSHTISNEVNTKNIHYYLISKDNIPVGYIGIKLEKKSLFLSKVYMMSTERSRGIGSLAVGFIKKIALSKRLERITLTVNIHNIDSIEAYKKMGFQITDNVCSDIGEGYVMDDYKMELKV